MTAHAYGMAIYPSGRHGDTDTLIYCGTCGSFVFNMNQHTDWHLGKDDE